MPSPKLDCLCKQKNNSTKRIEIKIPFFRPTVDSLRLKFQHKTFQVTEDTLIILKVLKKT